MSEGNEAPTRQPLRNSVSRGQVVVLCPRCPEDSDGEGLATVGRVEDEWGSEPILERFEGCPNSHTEDDLTPEQTAHILESAVEYLADATEALRDMANDQAMDYYRDEGRFND